MGGQRAVCVLRLQTSADSSNPVLPSSSLINLSHLALSAPPPKGTVVEKSINYLFEGHTESYVECKSVDVRSTKRESFMDIQLVVKVGRRPGRARVRVESRLR